MTSPFVAEHLLNSRADEYIYVWPCGTWCYAEDLEEFLTSMSDDYERIHMDDARAKELTQ